MVKRTLALGLVLVGGAAWWLGPERFAELWDDLRPSAAMADFAHDGPPVIATPSMKAQVDVPEGALDSTGATMLLVDANLRAGPGVDHDVKGRLSAGTMLEAVEKGQVESIAGLKAPWWRVITADGQVGWLFGGSLGSATWYKPSDSVPVTILSARFDGQGELQVGHRLVDDFHLARMGTFVTPTETLRGARISLLDANSAGVPLLHVSVGDGQFEQWWLPTPEGLQFVARTEFVEEDIGYTATAVEFRPRDKQVVVQDILGEWIGIDQAEEELTAHVLQLSDGGVERLSSNRERRTVTRERELDTDAMR